LIRLLRREKDGGVIEQTSLALQWLQAKEAIPELKRAASHPSIQTRCWVLQAIGKLGTESDLAFLANHLYDSESFVCIDAAQALEMITGEDFGFPKGSGPMTPLPPVEAARKWWAKNQSKFK
jgi:HEAT repeat protein